MQWQQLRSLAKSWPFFEEPLYRVHKGGFSTVTHRDSAELYQALVDAEAGGVDATVVRATDAVVARHPEGDEYRGRVLSRVQTVVRAGEGYERRAVLMLGMSREALAGAVTAVRDDSSEGIRMEHELCAGIAARRQGQAQAALDRYAARLAEDDPRRALEAGTSLGGLLAPLFLARCFEGSAAPPLEVDAAYAAIEAALDRLHPAAVQDETCTGKIAELAEAVGEAGKAELATRPPDNRIAWVETRLLQLFRLQSQRCLVP